MAPADTRAFGQGRRLKLLVAVLTRQRPKMLGELLDSWAQCTVPAGCEVEFAVIENDAEPFSGYVAEKFAGRLPGKLSYTVEPRRGIPFGRNAAANMAMKQGFDLLAFIDDDEIADRNWISALLARYRESGAMLIGGPVIGVAEVDQMNFWRRMLFRGIEHRYRQKAARNVAGFSNSKRSLPTIITNNWLADVELFTRHQLKFDESLVVSGGSDASFDRAVSAKGLSKAWAEDARVYEQIPPERISFRYQFRRGRDQSIASARRKRKHASLFPLITLPAVVLFRFAGMLAAAVSIPFLGGPALISLARSSGWLCGRLMALAGGESRLYEKTTGQ